MGSPMSGKKVTSHSNPWRENYEQTIAYTCKYEMVLFIHTHAHAQHPKVLRVRVSKLRTEPEIYSGPLSEPKLCIGAIIGAIPHF